MFDAMHNGWMWGMHWIWWSTWILLVGGVVWAIARAQRGPERTSSSESETALETLQRRYAEGEISAAEYEERKARLEG